MSEPSTEGVRAWLIENLLKLLVLLDRHKVSYWPDAMHGYRVC